jgi:NAD-dependent SIR2 family protein deacetylase
VQGKIKVMDNLKIERIKTILSETDVVIVGAGAGLSTAAGFTYSGQRFDRYFSDFAVKYGFNDMYSGGFYPFDSAEEHWAYWSRYVMINRYMDPPKPVYQKLLSLIREKEYFVITTNVDHCFQKAGFDKHRLFYTQGDYGLFQCSVPCHSKTYDNELQILSMYQAQKEMKIPTELIPHCPVCGRQMCMNLRADETFVQDEGWYEAAARYEKFLEKHHVPEHKRIVLLELGVGANTPGIIKYPFWRMTAQNANAIYISINLGDATVPEALLGRSICINADIGKVLDAFV